MKKYSTYLSRLVHYLRILFGSDTIPTKWELNNVSFLKGAREKLREIFSVHFKLHLSFFISKIKEER